MAMNRLPPAARLFGIGWYFAVCIVGGVIGGFFLDKVADSSPVLTMLGLLFGMGIAFYGGYRMLIEVLRDSEGPKE